MVVFWVHKKCENSQLSIDSICFNTFNFCSFSFFRKKRTPFLNLAGVTLGHPSQGPTEKSPPGWLCCRCHSGKMGSGGLSGRFPLFWMFFFPKVETTGGKTCSMQQQRRQEFIFFSRKTFRRRVLQKIVCVSHTTHIPHISSTSHISHTYPFQTYPPHISHTYPAHRTYPTHIHSKRIPPIRIPPVRIHAMRIHSKGCNTYPTNHHTYPIHIQHIIHIPHISIPNVSLPNVSHQYVSIANVSIQKVCISRNRKRIPPIHIPPIRIFNTYPTSTDPFNAYPFKKFASAGMALSMSITAYHFIPFIPLLLGGNGNEYKNLAFPSILCKIINWI